MSTQTIESLSIPHSLWWPHKEINSKGENLKMLEYLKQNGGPVIETNGAFESDDKYHYEYDTLLLSTKIWWWRK